MSALLQVLGDPASAGAVNALSALVTAVATLVLAFVTWVLVKETRVLSKAASSAHVAASLEPNMWSLRHFEIVVQSTGNAAAYDIRVVITPEITPSKRHNAELGLPLQRISMLRPQQKLTSGVCEYGELKGKTFTLKVSWLEKPRGRKRHEVEYDLDMRVYDNMGYLGARAPLIQVAEAVKGLREDWKNVAHGSARIAANVFSQADRDLEDEERNQMYREMMQETDAKGGLADPNAPKADPSGPPEP